MNPGPSRCPPSSKSKQIRTVCTAKRFIIIAALCLGALLDAIDITIIGVAVPTLPTGFNALDDVGWYGLAYLFSLTVLQPVFGMIYKFFDPKIV